VGCCLLITTSHSADKDKKDEKEFGVRFSYEGKLFRFTVDNNIGRGKWVRDLNEARKKLIPEAS